MGIAKGAIKILMMEQQRRTYSGLSILTLGKQDVFVTDESLQQIAKQYRVSLAECPPSLSSKDHLRSNSFIDDVYLMKSLGFTACDAMDISGHEGATHLFDLNSDRAPDDLLEKYDVILDSGTSEHVFHLPNLLRNAHSMLRPGGRIIHVSPSSNHIDHGFYMFSPTLFYNYYSANNYSIERFSVFRYTPDLATPWQVSEYVPGAIDFDASFGGLDDGMYGIVCVVTKTAASTCHVVPQQGFARKTRGVPETAPPRTTNERVQLIRDVACKAPIVYAVLRRVKAHAASMRPWARKKGLGLPVTDKL